MSELCGTDAGRQRHMRYGEPACSACREAGRAYMREWRKSNPEAARRERRRNNANARALWRLAAAHPKEFRKLADEEYSKEQP